MTMKRLFIVSLFCLLAVPSVAQKFDCKEDWGKAKMPTGSIICVDFDYSLSSICGMPVSDYFEFHESFMQDKAEAEQTTDTVALSEKASPELATAPLLAALSAIVQFSIRPPPARMPGDSVCVDNAAAKFLYHINLMRGKIIKISAA